MLIFRCFEKFGSLTLFQLRIWSPFRGIEACLISVLKIFNVPFIFCSQFLQIWWHIPGLQLQEKKPSRSILSGKSMSVQILKLLLGYVNDMWLAGDGMKKLKWGEKNIE